MYFVTSVMDLQKKKMLAVKPQDLSSTSGTHTVKGENPQVVL